MQPSLQTERCSSVHRRRDWRVWWRLTRPHTLTAAFVPVCIGTVLALHETTIRISLFYRDACGFFIDSDSHQYVQ
jgi:1,4-dihydroxy-2-naphthoate octaprenyltransferase